MQQTGWQIISPAGFLLAQRLDQPLLSKPSTLYKTE
jgi:hypothetical protein